MSKAHDVARMNIYNYFVETLTDLADPTDEEYEEVKEDMMNAVDLLFEGLELDVTAIDGPVTTVNIELI